MNPVSEERVTDPEALQEMARATLRARVAQFLDPERGINLDELAELLGIRYPETRNKLRKGPYKNCGMVRRQGDRGETNLFHLVDREKFAQWFSDYIGWELPAWFLEEPEATQALGMLVNREE